MTYWTPGGVSRQEFDASLGATNFIENQTVYISAAGNDLNSGRNPLQPVLTFSRANTLLAGMPVGQKLIRVMGKYTYPIAPDAGTYALPSDTDLIADETTITTNFTVSAGTKTVRVKKIDVSNPGNNAASFPRDACIDVDEITGIVTFLGGTHASTRFRCRRLNGELRTLLGSGRVHCDVETTVPPRVADAIEVIGPGIRTARGLVHAGDPYFSATVKAVVPTINVPTATTVPINLWELKESFRATVSIVTVAGSEYLKIENAFAALGVADAVWFASFYLDFQHVTPPQQPTTWTIRAQTWIDVETVPVFLEETLFTAQTETEDEIKTVGGPEGFSVPPTAIPIYLRLTIEHDDAIAHNVNILAHETVFRLMGYKPVNV